MKHLLSPSPYLDFKEGESPLKKEFFTMDNPVPVMDQDYVGPKCLHKEGNKSSR
jgi:hypothetical protein